MELQWNKKPCPYLQTNIRQVQTQEQTQELRLPEELPDIGRVLCAWGQSVIRSKEWRGDGMNVSGGVSVSVLYQPEDGSNPRCVEAWLPFQVKWNFPQTRREGCIRVCGRLRGVDARTLSARKMMIRANVSVLGEALEPTEAQVCAPGELPEGVEVLTSVYPAVLPREAGEKQFFFEDEVRVPSVQKWVSFTLQPELTEQSVVGSRVVMRGSGQLHYVYLDDQGMVRSGSQDIPFAQFADLDRDYDKEATADVMLSVSSLEPEITSDGVRMQCGVAAQYLVKDRVLLEVAEDAYSPACTVSAVSEPLKLPMELDSRVETLDAQPMFQDGKMLDMTFLIDHPSQYREGDMVTLELPGQFQFLYQDMDGNLQTATENWTGTLTLPAAENTVLQPSVQGIETSGPNARVKLNLQTWADQEIPMISGLTVGETRQPDPDRPSLILRRMDTDSLWELAKATGSTMAAIRKANALTQDPEQGQMLLIPVS